MRHALFFVGVILLTLAGSVARIHWGLGVTVCVVSVLALAFYGEECEKDGADPKLQLEVGRYQVAEVVEQWHGNVYLLALKQHVDLDFEYRLAEVHWKLAGAPKKGDVLTVDPAGLRIEEQASTA